MVNSVLSTYIFKLLTLRKANVYVGIGEIMHRNVYCDTYNQNSLIEVESKFTGHK